MTRTKWKGMSEDDQNITIAEICGWRFHKRENSFMWSIISPSGESWAREQGTDMSMVPDYVNDLNLMHTAAKENLTFCNDPECKNDMCGKGTWGKYHRVLQEIMGDDSEEKMVTYTSPYEATAKYRAEAFVLTMDKK